MDSVAFLITLPRVLVMLLSKSSITFFSSIIILIILRHSLILFVIGFLSRRNLNCIMSET